MKTITKMKGLILLLMAVVLQSSAFAQEVITSTFTDQNLTTKEGVKWTGEASGFISDKGPQFLKGKKTISHQNSKNIASVEITYSSNSKGKGTITASVGKQNIGQSLSFGKNVAAGTTYTFKANKPLSGDIDININVKAGALYITKVVITTVPDNIVYPPSFSQKEGLYPEPFKLTISAEEGCSVKYTLDNSDPTKDNGTDYTAAINIDKTTTVKAIAIKGDQISEVATATYTLAILTGNGTFENPYTVDDIALLDANTEGWFKGSIKGTYKDGKPITTNPDTTNLAIGNSNTLIPIQLPKGNIRNVLNFKKHPELINHEIIFYGNKDNYFSNPNGIKNTSKVYGLWNLSISDAGYSTYFTNVAFETPADVEVGIVTGVEGNALTIDWTKYSTGKTVPANTGVLVKGNKGDYPYVIVNSSAQTPANNLLKGSVAAEQTAGADCKFYKLSMDNSSKNLGFYWGAENGAAFENAANKAYLAVPNAVAANLFGFVIEGDGTTGIESVEQAQKLVDVYTIDGMLVQKQVKANQALNGLRKGIYIVNGKKVIK